MTHRLQTRWTGIAAAALLAPAMPALAQLHETDIVLLQQGGTLRTYGVQPDGTLAPQRLFVGTLAETGAGSEPGFDSEPDELPEGAALPGSTLIGFEFARAVRVWNGSDFESVSPLPIRARLGPLLAFSPAVDPPAGTAGPGLALSTTADGVFHHHFTWATFDPEQTGPVAEEGLYLVTLRLVQPEGLLTASEPAYLVLNAGRDDQLEAAAAWVLGNLLMPVALCAEDFNRDGARNLDDLADFITDYYTLPAVPGGLQPAAPQRPDVAAGYGKPCPSAPDAPAPYAADAYRVHGYRVAYSADGGNACPLIPEQSFPNLDHLGEFITAYYASGC